MSEYSFGDSSDLSWELDQNAETGTESIVITIPTHLLHKPRKQFSVKLVNEKEGLYEVPKSESFVYATKDLKSNHRIVVQVYRAVKHEARQAEFDRATQAGLKVKPLKDGSDDVTVLASSATHPNRKRL